MKPKIFDLSVVIPARNEQFLARTVENILQNIRGNTEIIVVLDGYWDENGVPVDPRVTVIHNEEAIGQRAAINQAVRASNAKYVMKIDAHCVVDEGFDVKMMAEMHDDYTMVPRMYNLHAFDWVCEKGHRLYQGPTPKEGCKQCGGPMHKEIIFEPRWRRESEFYRFDKTLHFQYYGAYKNRSEARYGVITGYKLSFNEIEVSSSVIDFLTNFASSHFSACSSNCFWFGKQVSMNTVSFDSIDIGRGSRPFEIINIRNQTQMDRITATSIITDMVNNGNFTISTIRDWFNDPSENESVCKCFFSEVGTSTISAFIDSTSPIPAPGSTIKSDFVDKLSDILGGRFIYSEKTNMFHNGSVTLSPIHDNNLGMSLSLQGSCFMLTRKKFWELNICDEKHGSWGQQGTEVALKTWLSGGKVMVNKKTYYAHMFRTQGGDFGFPFPLSGSDTDKARQYSRWLFLEGNWPGAKMKLEDLLQQFYPVPDWHIPAEKEKKITKGVVYYTHHVGDPKILEETRQQIKRGMKEKHIVSVSLKPLQFGKNIVLDLQGGYLTMAKQILAGLEAVESDVVFFCEHDVLYHPKHFDFVPLRRDVVYYNTNVWRVRYDDGHALYCNNLQQLSGLCAYRDILITHYKKRVEMLEKAYKTMTTEEFGSYVRKQGFEPGTHGRAERVDDLTADNYQADFPNLDIRHDLNTTPSRWRKDQFVNEKYIDGWTEDLVLNIPGWDKDYIKSVFPKI